MSIFSSLFKHQPDALQLSDWLKNMNDVFVDRGSRLLDTNDSSPDLLVFFTLTNATCSADNILHSYPSISSTLGAIYRELRAYYECLWQIVLLGKHNSEQDQQKISKLYADVSLRMDGIIRSLFSQNPNINQLLSDAFDASYQKRFHEAVRDYILGEGSRRGNAENDLLSDNIQALTMYVIKAGGLGQSQRSSLSSILMRDTNNALRLKFLTQFDLHRCEFLELPDSFYE